MVFLSRLRKVRGGWRYVFSGKERAPDPHKHLLGWFAQSRLARILFLTVWREMR